MSIGSSCVTVCVSNSDFTSCKQSGTSIVFVSDGVNVGDVSIHFYHFTECGSEDANPLLMNFGSGLCTHLEVIGSVFDACWSGGSVAVFDVSVNTLEFDSNEFKLSVDGRDKFALGLHLPESGHVILRSSNFSNGECQLNNFLNASGHASFTFDTCIFEDIGSHFGGGGFKMNNSEINANNCIFRRLYCTNDGGAIHSGNGTKTLNLVGCVFESCWSDTGFGTMGGCGGVYIECDVSGRLHDCVFINNLSPKNGQSLQIMTKFEGTGPDRLDIYNCTFESHERGSIIFFGYYKDSFASALGVYGSLYRISYCNFTDNTISAKHDLNRFGFVNFQSSSGIVYEQCRFTRNTYSATESPFEGFVSSSNIASNGSPSCTVSSCLFDACKVGGSDHV